MSDSSTKFCKYCGKTIDPDAKFCQHCGKDLTIAVPRETAPPENQIQDTKAANKKRNRPIYIIGLILSICTVSTMCLLIAGNGSDTNKSTKVPSQVNVAEQKSSTTATPADTPEPTEPPATNTPEPTEPPITTNTPKPTNTPGPTNTPRPTRTPLPALEFSELVQNPEQKGWNSTQYDSYFDTIKGRSVSGWSGQILEIGEWQDRPYISLAIDSSEPKIDAYVYLTKSDLLKVAIGQEVTIDGVIFDDWREGGNYRSVQIEDSRLVELGVIPTATPRPTATPDRGSDGMAAVMCEDFVKDRLKSPSTAEFGGLFDDKDMTEAYFLEAETASTFGVDVESLINSGVWVATGEVDAQNGFGAMIRNKFVCVMDYDKNGGRWILLDISIE